MKKQKKILFGLLILFSIILLSLFPMVICIWGNIQSSNSWYALPWDASEMLAYYASILSFISTFLLGAIALWQSISADKRSRLSENKITAYIEKSNQVMVETIKLLDSMSIKVVLNVISNSIPLGTVVSKVSIDVGYGLSKRMEFSRKDVLSDIKLKNDTQLELIITFPIKCYDMIFDDERIKYVGLGFETEENYTQQNHLDLSIDVGFFNENVVTPVHMHMGLSPIINSILLDEDSKVKQCLYGIDDVNCFSQKSLFESEFETLYKS